MTLFLVAIGALVAVFLVSLASPMWRRAWVFPLLLIKYAILWLGDVTRIRKLVCTVTTGSYEPLTLPVTLRLFCEDMGPTFLKFGQMVASSAGMFPEKYVQEFQKVLDRVRPFSSDAAKEIIASELGITNARRLEMQEEPLASASIAQVHLAKLTLVNGDVLDVVVKVQRPHIQRRIHADIRIMRAMADMVSRIFPGHTEFVNPKGFVEDFASTLLEEIDFRKEAANIDRFNIIMRELGYTDVRAPHLQWDFITERVLVMERFHGSRVDDPKGISDRGLNAEETLLKGLRAWFQSVIFYGFFHGDVHAGNLMVLDSGDLGFLDFGIVGRFDERQRYLVTDYIIAFATGDYKTLARVIVEMGGVIDASVDMASFENGLKETYSPLLTMAFGDVNYADFIPRINKVAREHRMTMPKEFILITKQMLYFDRYAKILAPKLNVFSDPRLVMSLMADVQKIRMEGAAKTAATKLTPA